MLGKNPSTYGSTEQEKYFISPSHGSASNVSSNAGGAQSASGLRPHAGLLAPIPVQGTSHPSGIPIQQQNHTSKSGSIITGNPLRPPPSSGSYHSVAPAPNVSRIFS